jgi:hypothetical protein
MKRIAVMLLIFLFLTGVAGAADAVKKDAQHKNYEWSDIKKGTKPVEPKIAKEYDPLIKSFGDYWKATKDKKYDVTYAMESEKFRKETSFEKYKELMKPKKGQQPMNISSVRALEVKKMNEREVVVEGIIAYKAGFMDSLRPVKDRWVNEENGWRHLPSIKEVSAPAAESKNAAK